MSFIENIISTERLNKALGYGTYGLISYQFLQTAFFGSTFTSTHPWLSSFFPYNVDDSTTTGNTLWNWQSDHPLFNNVLLMILFGLQHSLQARLWFQSGIQRNLTPWLERLLFVSGSAIAFSLLMSFWQPMTYPVIWDFRGTVLESGLNGIYYAGLTWVLMTLGYDAMYDLFGFRKSFGETVTIPSVPEYLPPVYRASRSPLFGGLLLCFWASPIMTVGHFLFASLMTLYTVSAIQYQEKDKLTRLGALYAEYQRRVPLFIPSLSSLFNEADSITLPGAVQEKFDEKSKAAGDRPPVVSPIDVHRYQHVGRR